MVNDFGSYAEKQIIYCFIIGEFITCSFGYSRYVNVNGWVEGTGREKNLLELKIYVCTARTTYVRVCAHVRECKE